MLDPLGNLVNGMFFGIGTIIVSTIAIYIGFKRGSKFVEKVIAMIVETWAKVKEEGLIIEGKVESKKKEKKK